MTNLKQQAAESAATLVQEGMLVGLGTGSTAAFLVTELGRRIQAGLRIRAVATSKQTADLARSLGIELTEWTEEMQPDLTIDGADEVEEGTLNLVKGLGGALLREKIVASVSRRVVIVADESKMVPRLGRGALPVEIYAWQSTAHKLRALGAAPSLRMNAGQPFLSDGGHYILDCKFADAYVARLLAGELDRTVGVVEHGLFLGMAEEVHIAGADGLKVIYSKG